MPKYRMTETGYTNTEFDFDAWDAMPLFFDINKKTTPIVSCDATFGNGKGVSYEDISMDLTYDPVYDNLGYRAPMICGLLVVDSPTSGYSHIDVYIGSLRTIDDETYGTLGNIPIETRTNPSGNVTINGLEIPFSTSFQQNFWTPAVINSIDSIPKNQENSLKVNANFPIFANRDDAISYIETANPDFAINYRAPFDEDTEDYYIYNRYQHATYKNGSPTWDGDSHGAYERILAPKGSLCLYRYAEPNAYMIKTSGSVVGSYFHHNSKPAVENADPADFTDGTLIYQSPFYDSYKKEMGDVSGNFGLFGGIGKGSGNTNIPMFASLQDAEDYLDGNKSIEDAENYDYLINGFGENPVNPTGTKEELTENGVNMSRGVFAVDYCMARSGLASLGGDFFSDTFLEDMKKGLELYGNNPMRSVLQALYFPFDISQIYSTVGVNFVAFGSYQHPVSGYGINKILFNTGLKDLGSTFIRPTYGNFLDYTATEIFCFLPYVGWVNLDVNKYMNTTLAIKYAIDIHSGECTAMLYSNGRLMDCYDGQCGIKQPITSEDMSSYFMAQIEGMKSAMSSVTGGALQGAQVGAKGGAYGAIAGGAVGATLGGINAGTTLYGLSKMRPQLFSSGGYSGALGANLPQYPILVFCFHDTEEPANLLQTHGKPSNKSGSIGSFAGFLSLNSCNLKCGIATNNEKDKIMAYLASGIII